MKPRLLRLAILCPLLVFLPLAPLFAQSPEEAEPTPMARVAFVVLVSTTSYSEAMQKVAEVSRRTKIPIDLRGVVFDPAFGLTFSREKFTEWQDPFYSYPWYFPRGRYDAGEYLSIERSDAYSSFAPGFFVVIAASGYPDSPELQQTLIRVRKVYRSSYIKVAEVYHGCMH